MNRYVTLNSQGQQPRRLKVLFDGFKPMIAQPKEIIRLPTSVVKQFGKPLRVWHFVAKVDYSPATNYASIAEVEAWFSANTTAANSLTFVDHFGTSYSVFITNDYDPTTLTPVWDSQYNAILVPFELQEVGS